MRSLMLGAILLLSLAGLAILSACAGSASTREPTVAEPIINSPVPTAQTNSESTNSSTVTLPTTTASFGKVMILDFPLSDLTDLPNPPEELARIAYFNITFKQKLADDGVQIVPVNDKIKAIAESQSATYLFDHTDIAAGLAEGGDADYIIIGVAMKPTYLFVYPRMLLVDIKTKRKVFTTYVQMEGSWLDKTTTASSAVNLAKKVSAELKHLKLLTSQ